MSYRSIKRVLGETSLERKCRFLFGACLLLLITASFWVYGSQTEKLVNQQNRTVGRLLVDQVMLAVHWKEVTILEERAKLLDEGAFPKERFLPLLPEIKDLTKRLSKQEYEFDFIRPNSTDGTGMPRDEFEWKVFDAFLNADSADLTDPDALEFRERFVPDKNEYQYYQPIRAEESCLLVCHRASPAGAGLDLTTPAPAMGNVTAVAPGGLLSIVKVTIPNDSTQRALNWNRAILLSTAIITVFLAMIASYIIVRYVIVKPLRHLRDVSDAISHGNIALRAEIHTGDEFESLAVAFNRMLGHLVTIQEELRQVNADLDAKVDELAQVNMRLYEMNTIKSDFLATMSHELRTPLNSILGFSEVLGSIDSLKDKQKRYVQNIQTSGRMLLEMINDILDLAKMESGKMDVRLTDFHVEQIVHAQCDMARPLTEKKNIDLETQIQGGLPVMHQDQSRVQQILNNLLTNAIKFTPEGGRITVIARRDDKDFLVMQVIDTGVGIADEDQQTIFEKFRQARSGAPSGDAMTREYSGTGLGLSIVRELCRLLGGEVSVQSELGKGSTFTVRLPWVLKEQPRLDSALIDGFQDFTKPRFDIPRNRSQDVA
ncbi:MAG: HAMP domain-containing protein [Pirellulales bacterium]|nr:HAMP domain-containing protein [Pirellulales bacterium]